MFDNNETKPKHHFGLNLFLLVLAFAGLFAAYRLGVAQGRQAGAAQVLTAEQSRGGLLGKVLGTSSVPPSIANQVDFQLFWKTWELLKKDYVKKDELKEQDMFYGAIRGLVAATGDPYTVFLDPKESKALSEDLAGTFEGIGAEIGIKKERLVIIAPLPDSPAEKAGLRPGDAILAIDGQASLGMSVDEAVSKIRGAKDTVVSLTILHSGQDKTEEIKITRGVITLKSVESKLLDNGLYLIKVTNFNDDTEALFAQAVEDILAKKPKGVILDLRNNPGGYLETAINMASYWVDGGIVVSEKFGDGRQDDYRARGLAKLKDYPTVVLINQGSASASEIVAGALKDNHKATLVGKQSFGKGSVQILENLDGGAALKVTVAQWLTPAGNNISEKGIAPDQAVELTPEDYEAGRDPQLDKASELLLPKPAPAKK